MLGNLDDFSQKEPLELKAFKRILDKGNKLNKVGFAAQSLSQTDYNELLYGVYDSYEIIDESMKYVPGHLHYDTNRLTFDTSETLESGDRDYKTNKRPYGSMYCDEVTPDGKRVDANGTRID